MHAVHMVPQKCSFVCTKVSENRWDLFIGVSGRSFFDRSTRFVFSFVLSTQNKVFRHGLTVLTDTVSRSRSLRHAPLSFLCVQDFHPKSRTVQIWSPFGRSKSVCKKSRAQQEFHEWNFCRTWRIGRTFVILSHFHDFSWKLMNFHHFVTFWQLLSIFDNFWQLLMKLHHFWHILGWFWKMAKASFFLDRFCTSKNHRFWNHQKTSARNPERRHFFTDGFCSFLDQTNKYRIHLFWVICVGETPMFGVISCFSYDYFETLKMHHFWHEMMIFHHFWHIFLIFQEISWFFMILTHFHDFSWKLMNFHHFDTFGVRDHVWSFCFWWTHSIQKLSHEFDNFVDLDPSFGIANHYANDCIV